MDKLYFDATQPLRWGPHPPVGIPRVESALLRQVLRRSDLDVEYYLVENDGRARMLSPAELRYLEALVERRIPFIEGVTDEPFLKRAAAVAKMLRASGGTSGKELDRVAGVYLSGRSDRSGISYALAKLGIRIGKFVLGAHGKAKGSSRDPLSDPTAHCFLSNVGVHQIAGHRSSPTKAVISAILHDTIPLSLPQFFNKGHASSFARDFSWMSASCAQLVCVSKYSAEAARGALSDEEKAATLPAILVNPLGSFMKEGLQGKATEPVEALVGHSFAVYCSTIEIRKNHITLLRTWHRLMPRLGDRLPDLVIVGRWGWMVDEAKQFLDAHPELLTKVHFLAGISDPQLAWLYKNARFGVFPSFAEGWGLGAAECLDFGLPVLISDAPALGEATQGLMPVVPADDLDGWCAAIERASTDDEWLAALRATIAERHRPTSEADFADGLLALMGGPPGQSGFGPPAASSPAFDKGSELAAASGEN